MEGQKKIRTKTRVTVNRMRTLRALRPLTLLATVAQAGPQAGMSQKADVRYSTSARKYVLQYSVYTVYQGQKDHHVLHIHKTLNSIVKIIKAELPKALATPLLAALAHVKRLGARPERKQPAYRIGKER